MIMLGNTFVRVIIALLLLGRSEWRGQSRIMQTTAPGHSHTVERRGGAPPRAMLSWWRRNRFSALSQRRNLNRSMN